MTSGGFQTAMSAFVGQNYGAKNGIGSMGIYRWDDNHVHKRANSDCPFSVLATLILDSIKESTIVSG